MDRWIDGWMDGWIDVCTCMYYVETLFGLFRSLDQYHDLGIVGGKKRENLRSGSQSKYQYSASHLNLKF
jgi:hypothetical protein